MIDTIEIIVAEMRTEARATRPGAPLLAARLDEYADRLDEAQAEIHTRIEQLCTELHALTLDITDHMRGRTHDP